MTRIAMLFILTPLIIGCDKSPEITRGNDLSPPPTIATKPETKPETKPPSNTDNATPTTTTVTDADLTEAQQTFRQQWQAADTAGKRPLTDLAHLTEVFWQATKPQVEAALGKPSHAGLDEFQSDVMRYELGAAPESLGDPHYHVTFEFAAGKVISVLGNTISRRP